MTPAGESSPSAIQELKLKLTGMIDAESAQRIGKFLHAQFVVGGTMTDMTGDVAVNCRGRCGR